MGGLPFAAHGPAICSTAPPTSPRVECQQSGMIAGSDKRSALAAAGNVPAQSVQSTVQLLEWPFSLRIYSPPLLS